MRRGRLQRTAAALLLLAGFGATLSAHADSVTLTGTIGSRAILVVNGGAPKTLAVGERFQGVRLVSLQDGQAVIEAIGAPGTRAERVTLRMDTPISVGNSSGSGDGTRIVLSAGSGGHFTTQGTINGRAVTFMLDTGATTVALSAADAERLGLAYKNGAPVQINTANGTVVGYRVQLDSVRVGDVVVSGVDAVVSPQSMPYVLLGNSFINRFSLRRDSDQMVLEKRF
ncbi:MAG: retropepsin-like aspartic protease family protein [Janthinobacterium lividum]